MQSVGAKQGTFRVPGAPLQPVRRPARSPVHLNLSFHRLRPGRCSLSAPVPSSSQASNGASEAPGHQRSGDANQAKQDRRDVPEIEPLAAESSEALSDPNSPPTDPIWCLGAPSATSSLRHIRDELYHLSGRNTTTQMNKILRRDPDAAASRSSSLRALVATLLDLRENPPSTTPNGEPAPLNLRPWTKAPLERSLFTGEVRRVHRDLLKSQQDLHHLATSRAALSAAKTVRPTPDPPKDKPRWRRMVSSALFLPDISRAFQWLRRSVSPHFMLPDFSLWSLRTVQRFADELPHDAELQARVSEVSRGRACMQAALLRRLNAAGRHSEIVQRVASGAYKTSPACEVEYLAAMVHTGNLDQFRGEGPPPAGVAHNSLPRLLEEVRARMVNRAPSGASMGGSAAEAIAETPGALTGALLSGAKETAPLHVRLQNPPNAQPNALVAAFRNVFSFFATIVVIMTLWVIGAAAEGTLQARGSMAGSNGTMAEKPNSGHAPKEYNKDNIPEGSVKTFEDVKGAAEAKAELQEVVEYLKNPAKFVKLGAKLPKGILLSGPPGTGKTLLARAVAGEAGVPFFYRAGSEFEEMFVGVGSKRVRQLFQAAKARTPCIIFIDEIDAVGSNRRSWENHSRKTLNQILTEMDGFEENAGVIVMAATNLPEVLDPALTRPGRFDRHVTIDLPDIQGRKEILDHYLKSKPTAEDVDGKTFASKTPGFSGAQLANMINEAALAAAKQGVDKIDASMLDEARDKVMMGRERSLTRTEKSIRHTAYHEAGHALVAMFTPGADPLHKATINPRGPALGLTWQMPPADEYSRSLTQLRASVDVCMGGQVAETLVFGPDEVGAGATSDLKQATRLARHMVCDCGFSEAIGPMCVDERSSQATQQAADKEVRGVLQAAKDRVKVLLRKRMAELHAVAAALINQETLDQAQISEICQKASEDSTPEPSEFQVDGTADASPLPA